MARLADPEDAVGVEATPPRVEPMGGEARRRLPARQRDERLGDQRRAAVQLQLRQVGAVGDADRLAAHRQLARDRPEVRGDDRAGALDHRGARARQDAVEGVGSSHAAEGTIAPSTPRRSHTCRSRRSLSVPCPGPALQEAYEALDQGQIEFAEVQRLQDEAARTRSSGSSRRGRRT
jgi:hypothetical protein